MESRISSFFAQDLASERGALLAVVCLAALVTLPFARMIGRAVKRREGEGGHRQPRLGPTVLTATIWPLLTILVATAPLLLLPGKAPVAARLGVLSLGWVLLLHGVADAGVQRFMAPGMRRRRLRWFVVPMVLVIAALDQTGLLGPLIEHLGRPFLVMGGATISVLSIVISVALALAFILGARIFSDILAHRFLPNFGVDQALADTLGAVGRSMIIVLGILVSADAMGLDMSSLKIVLGALSVGIGFGLQNVVNNFVSGLILMFERTIKRGDIIRINETEGRVLSIGLRSSVVQTRAGHEIIVPNGELVAGHVDNLSFKDEHVRVDVNVGVSYAADPELVKTILLEIASRTDEVLPAPPPEVLFMGYGESSLDFELRVWVNGAWALPRVRSALLFAGWYALKEAGIEIPFPQRDLNLRGGVLHVQQVTDQTT